MPRTLLDITVHGAAAPQDRLRVCARSGVLAARGWCEVCSAWVTGDLWLPAHYRSEEHLVVIQDNSGLPRHTKPDAPCERCGLVGPTETHHWAPVALFDDAWDWPLSDLCTACHRRWHDVMRSAGLDLERQAA